LYLTKFRVYEYAKQMNMSSKEIITILSRLNIPVNNHMSVMEPRMIEAVEGFFSDVKARAAARTAAQEEERRRRAEQEALRLQNEERLRAEREAAQQAPDGAWSGESTGGAPVATQEYAAPAAHARGAVASADMRSRPQEADEPLHTLDAGAARVTGARSTREVGGRVASSANDAVAVQGATREPAPGAERPVASGGGTVVVQPTAEAISDGAQQGAAATQGATSSADSVARPHEDSSSARAGGTSSHAGSAPRTGGGSSYDRSAAPRTGGGSSYDRGAPRTGGGASYDRGAPRTGGGSSYDRGAPRTGGGSSYGGGAARTGGGSSYGGGAPRTGGGSSYGGGAARTGGGSSYGGGAARTGGGSSYGGGAPRTGGGAPRSASSTGGAPRPGGGFGARPDNRSGAGAGSRTDGRRSGGFGFAASGAAPGARPGEARGTGAGSRRRPGDRTTGGRPQAGDRRENSRKLQPPRKARGRAAAAPRPFEGPRQVSVDAAMTVAEYAHILRREASEVIKKLLLLGMPATINQEIDTDTMVVVGQEFGTEVLVAAPRDIEAEELLTQEDETAEVHARPPVVTIMGHVDHGKTTLLDAIRETNVTASEAGGITQHIGAYQVERRDRKITFLDTPGHAAFTTMRARGAQVTDITVLVVAADDGVMPQTVEAIDHAKAANVPIIVAINKMDKPGANPDRIKQELTEHGLVAEEWGGDTIFVGISALKKEGIDELLETILLVADVADLKASSAGRARGTVIEAQLDKGRGPVATVLVQNGTLRIGDVVMAGNTFGRIRAMVNDHGRRVKDAPPSLPVEIIGLNDVPGAGDAFVVYDDERQARLVAERRTTRRRMEELGASTRITLDDLFKQIQQGEVKDLNLIVKADVQGSTEAIMGALQKIDVSGVRIRVIHSGVGAITESDILLASASNAIVLGFNVRPETNAARMAESEKVDVRLYRVIYNLIEEVEAALKGMLDPVLHEVVVGRAEVRQLFKVSKVGTIAGAFVVDGKLVRDSDARVIRSGVVVHEGRLDSLKRFKDDVREVATGYECGLTFERFNDLKEGDVVEAFKMEAIKVE
jgi:translation initiation factor IF-2